MGFPDDIGSRHPTPIEQLQIAFAAQIARDIVAADQILDIDEVRLMMVVFPDALMSSCGFLTPATELTDGFHVAYLEAVQVLPLVLDPQQKLQLVTLFHRTCVVDGELHPSELEVLTRAAKTLAIDDTILEAHLEDLHGSLTALELS